MNKNIAVIGCGQLGCRHIQGLGVSKSQMTIHVFDKSPISLNKCMGFTKEISDELENVCLLYHSSLDDLGETVDMFDFTIVASTARDRPGQMASVLSKVNAKNWMLEKPLSQSIKELDELQAILSGQNVWVNHFRRIVPWHQQLRKLHFAGQPVDMVIAGSDLGIGCNISHFVDLVNYWSDEIPIDVRVSDLDKSWHDSKRPGFKEVNGELALSFSKGSTLRVVSSEGSGEFSIVGKLQASDSEFSIDENNAIAFVGLNDPIEGVMPYQSQLTGKVLDQLEQTGTCELTPLDVATDCYRPVAEALLSHWQSTLDGRGDTVVPLT